MRSGLVVAVALVVTFACATASAQTNGEDMEAARIHFQAGSEHYARGKYSESILEFKEAYRLSKKAALLYNVSQAYEKMNDLPHAREYLKSYIDSGETEPGEMSTLQEKLRSLDDRIAAAPPTTLPSATQPAVVTPPIAATPAAEPRRPFKAWRWITGGAGVVFLAAAGIFMFDGNAAANSLENTANKVPLREYDNILQDTYARGRRDNILSVAFGVTGVALVGTGIALYIMDRKHQREVVVPQVSSSGFGVSAFWTF